MFEKFVKWLFQSDYNNIKPITSFNKTNFRKKNDDGGTMDLPILVKGLIDLSTLQEQKKKSSTRVKLGNISRLFTKEHDNLFQNSLTRTYSALDKEKIKCIENELDSIAFYCRRMRNYSSYKRLRTGDTSERLSKKQELNSFARCDYKKYSKPKKNIY